MKLLAPPPATPTSALPASVSAGSTGVNVTISGSSVGGTGFFDPGMGFASHIAALVNGGGVTVNSVTFNSPTSIVLNIDVAPGAAAGARTVTVTNPDGQSATSASGILTITSATAPTITLKINGEHPTPPVVPTTGPVLVTLDVNPGSFTAPVAWFWALQFNGQLVWVTPGGLSITPAPLLTAPPVPINNATLLNFTLPPASTFASAFFFLDGGTVVAFDTIAATRP